jgi:hypothetical protein
MPFRGNLGPGAWPDNAVFPMTTGLSKPGRNDPGVDTTRQPPVLWNWNGNVILDNVFSAELQLADANAHEFRGLITQKRNCWRAATRWSLARCTLAA